jgi:hypothetical protein
MRWTLASSRSGSYAARGIITDTNRIKGQFEVVDLNTGAFLRTLEFPEHTTP